jgi:Cu/Ag efflux protein CusF
VLARSKSRRPPLSKLLILLGVTLVLVLPAACSRESSPKEPEHQYQMEGIVVRLDAKLQTATIKHGPIKGWMEAMTMEYPVPSKSDFAKLHEGDKITATVDVSGSDYSLSHVQVQSGSQ